MRHWVEWSPSAIALCVLALSACSAEKSRAREQAAAGVSAVAPRSSAAPVPERPSMFRAATYNGGLAAGALKYVDERAEPLVRALAEQPMDLLCVQEFWLEEHWQKLASATSDVLPYTFRLPADPAQAGCAKKEVEPLLACAAKKCAGLPQHGVPVCLLRGCSVELTGLSTDCFNCLSASPRKGIDELARACAPPRLAGAAAGRPQRAGAAPSITVYSGSSGTAVLTNTAILDRDSLVLPSAVDRRTVLYAKLSPPSIGELHVFCTHLTASMEGVPHPGKTSWHADQSAQIDALLAYVDRKTGGRGATLLLGDLNTGPAIAPYISARLPAHYARFLARGFSNPYASQRDAK